MNSNNRLSMTAGRISIVLVLIVFAGCASHDERVNSQPMERLPNIQPDYSGITIPPNIAPLNFSIKESGEAYLVQINSKNGEPIKINSNSGAIEIPYQAWKKLLANNIGQQLTIDILMKKHDGRWARFNSIVNQIAQDSIDGYVAYRRFGPLYNLFVKMGIFQRSLENFSEQPILLNRLTSNNCMNCHSFYQGKTNRWLLHMRGGPGTSMLLAIDGRVQKIDTKTKFNGPTAYPAWHPSGELIAFSVSKLQIFFHQTGECRDVLDLYSKIVLYDIPTNTITTTPAISDPERMEIWPAWSPDGKALYFCSAPKLQTYVNLVKQDELAYDRIQYDLMRIPYDPATHSWGKLETVISASEIGLSITEPRVSPDGRFVLFTAAKYSQFPIYLPSADLYLLDVASGTWKRMDINSDKADSFHSWSSDSRWIVFSSKRHGGAFTRSYFSHIDSAGNATKPFVLPQENPSFYESCIEVFNAPEFVKEPVQISPQALAKAAYSEALPAKLDPRVSLNR